MKNRIMIKTIIILSVLLLLIPIGVMAMNTPSFKFPGFPYGKKKEEKEKEKEKTNLAFNKAFFKKIDAEDMKNLKKGFEAYEKKEKEKEFEKKKQDLEKKKQDLEKKKQDLEKKELEEKTKELEKMRKVNTEKMFAAFNKLADDEVLRNIFNPEELKSYNQEIDDDAEIKELEKIKLAINNGADIDAKDKKDHNRTPLYKAAASGLSDIFLLLFFNKDANVKEAIDDTGGTLLHAVTTEPCDQESESTRLDMVQLLIGRNVINVDATTTNGETALSRAILNHCSQIAEELIVVGGATDVNSGTDYVGNTPLHNAVSNNDEKIVQLLVDRGAERNAKNNAGKTPLDIAKSLDPDSNITALLSSY